jgi:hypothetical protein
MSADDYNKVSASARGRKSVRISSKSSWADSLIVLDLAHMPEGCGTWPAFWTVSAAGPWPTGGEIDILEGDSERHRPTIVPVTIILGVHLQNENLASQHTRPKCTMPNNRQMKGYAFTPRMSADILTIGCSPRTPTSTNCDTSVNYNEGCGVSFSEKKSYGASFNKAGGGYYVMQRTKQHGAQVWFWSRCVSSVLSDHQLTFFSGRILWSHWT